MYGVPEINDPNSTGGSPVPSGCNIGFQRGDIDKETIENRDNQQHLCGVSRSLRYLTVTTSVWSSS